MYAGHDVIGRSWAIGAGPEIGVSLYPSVDDIVSGAAIVVIGRAGSSKDEIGGRARVTICKD